MSRYLETLVDQYLNLEDFLNVLKLYLSYDETSKTHFSLINLREQALKFIQDQNPIGFWGEKSKRIEYAVNAHVLAQHLQTQNMPTGFSYLSELINDLADFENDAKGLENFNFDKINKIWSDVRHFRGSIQHRMSDTD